MREGSNLGGFSCYPDCSEGDVSIPSYHAYNHHYFSWLTGADAVMKEADTPHNIPNPTTTMFETAEGVEHGYPTNIVFKVASICILNAGYPFVGESWWRIQEELSWIPQWVCSTPSLSTSMGGGANAD